MWFERVGFSDEGSDFVSCSVATQAVSGGIYLVMRME
jgi:hypothetical protein